MYFLKFWVVWTWACESVQAWYFIFGIIGDTLGILFWSECGVIIYMQVIHYLFAFSLNSEKDPADKYIEGQIFDFIQWSNYPFPNRRTEGNSADSIAVGRHRPKPRKADGKSFLQSFFLLRRHYSESENYTVSSGFLVIYAIQFMSFLYRSLILFQVRAFMPGSCTS